jgi:hypothetical protein
MERSPRRAGESLSLACCTRHRSRAALSLSLSGRPVQPLAPCRAEGWRTRMRQRPSPARAETARRQGGKASRLRPRAAGIGRGPTPAQPGRETPKTVTEKDGSQFRLRSEVSHGSNGLDGFGVIRRHRRTCHGLAIEIRFTTAQLPPSIIVTASRPNGRVCRCRCRPIDGRGW